eukprot:99966-Amphidinium_carterae.1
MLYWNPCSKTLSREWRLVLCTNNPPLELSPRWRRHQTLFRWQLLSTQRRRTIDSLVRHVYCSGDCANDIHASGRDGNTPRNGLQSETLLSN